MTEAHARRRVALLLGGATLLVLSVLVWRIQVVLESRAGAVFEAVAAWSGLRLSAREVRFSLWPPRVLAEGVHLEVARDAVAGSPVRIDHLELGVALTPLLEGRIVVDAVAIEGLVLRAARLANGAWNLRRETRPLPVDIVLAPLAFRADRVHLGYRDARQPGGAELEIRGELDAHVDAALQGVDLLLTGSLAGESATRLKVTGRIPLTREARVELLFDVGNLPAARIGEIVQLAGGRVPFEWSASGPIELKAKLQTSLAWPPEQGRLFFEIDAGAAGIAALGPLIRKPVGRPLRLDGRIRFGERGPGLQQVELHLESGVVRIFEAPAQPGALVVASEDLDLRSLGDLVPVLNSVGASGAVAVAGALRVGRKGLAGRLDMLAPAMAMGGKVPAGVLQNVGVQIALRRGGAHLGGRAVSTGLNGDLFSAGALAATLGVSADHPGSRLEFRWQDVGRGADRFDIEARLDLDDSLIRIRDLRGSGLNGQWQGMGVVSMAPADGWPLRLELGWTSLEVAGLLRLAGVEPMVAGRSEGKLGLAGTLDGTLVGLVAKRGDFDVTLVPISRQDIERLARLPSMVRRLLGTSQGARPVALHATGRLGLESVEFEKFSLGDKDWEIRLAGPVAWVGKAELFGELRLEPSLARRMQGMGRLLLGRKGSRQMPISMLGRWPNFDLELLSAGTRDADLPQSGREPG